MTDPFPLFTAFLDNALLYLIFIGIILATISGVISGILYLPIFGFSERRAALGSTALRMTIIGIAIIILTIPIRNALLSLVPVPVSIPAIPLTTPTVPVPSPTHATSTIPVPSPTRVP
jgi:hypothetical protein